MENASKALIMAGGLLIAVMVIGVSMYIISTARGIAYEANKEAEASAKESFNRYYQSFGTDVKGIDVVNLCNKADDDTSRDGSIHPVSTNIDVKEISSDKFLNPYTYSYNDTDGDGYIDTLTFN